VWFNNLSSRAIGSGFVNRASIQLRKTANLRHVAWLIVGICAAGSSCARESSSEWTTATPESQGLLSDKLDAMWNELRGRKTTAFLVIRNDRIVYERYGNRFSRRTPHYTASLAKSLVGGLSLMLAMDDGRMRPDDRADTFVPQWAGIPGKNEITLRHLATHTSGMEDAEADHLSHEQLTGWKDDFWKRLPTPHDPFTISRDVTPVLETPGTNPRYSNPGMAMLSYCLTASLQGAPQTDLRSLLKARIMDPIGVSQKEWSVGYGQTTILDGLPLVASWGGGEFSPNACARVGSLLLHKGDWHGKQLISRQTVQEATQNAGMPNHSGLGWWVNRKSDGTLVWPSVPGDAFWGLGAQGQFLLVVPSLNLIVVRSGGPMTKADDAQSEVGPFIVSPLMQTFAHNTTAPYPPSPVIKGTEWADENTIVRYAPGSDNWPITWGDDDTLYTAYGDGNGFKPFVPKKLSLGFARVKGSPVDIVGENIRSSSGEQKGEGPNGRKASGLLMVDSTLFMWVRNAGNSQLAWSTDHATTWTWADWKFTESFGCPTFLNFGCDYAGARDNFIYVYSPDVNTAYEPADRLVLARVPKERIRERDAYEFFVRVESNGNIIWSHDIADRGPVFSNPGEVCRSHITYNPALKRYLLTMIGPVIDSRFAGGLGVYDAPEPWGPWTTAFYTDAWDVGPGESASFPSKWLAADGRSAWLVFSGDDRFSIRRANFALSHEKNVTSNGAVKLND
jgi:CubicO group peptidase (beta-lactamase class C family)